MAEIRTGGTPFPGAMEEFFLKLRDGVELAYNDDGAILLDTRGGVYWHINDSGAQLIRALSEKGSFEAAVDEVAREHGVTHRTVQRDFTELLKDLKKARMVEGRIP